MTSRRFSATELLELLEDDTFCSDEVLQEGSDEEFDAEEVSDSEDTDDLQEIQSGMSNNCLLYKILLQYLHYHR